jgi:hypothetical protein
MVSQRSLDFNLRYPRNLREKTGPGRSSFSMTQFISRSLGEKLALAESAESADFKTRSDPNFLRVLCEILCALGG